MLESHTFVVYNTFRRAFSVQLSFKQIFLTTFYKDVLYTRQNITELNKQVVNEILWTTLLLKFEVFSVYYERWHKTGVVAVKDIFIFNNVLTPHQFHNNFNIKTHFLNITQHYSELNAICEDKHKL